jgi:ABC-2 type transport system ATP-binding protein
MPDLSLPPGNHWIKGRNGSGKTTLFKVLAGLLPYQGQIILNQQILLSQHPVKHRDLVNYGEAEPLYPDFLTGLELVSLFAKAKRAPAGQVNHLSQMLGIDLFLRKAVGTYSSGMLKKLSLLLAFLGHPQLILLDEPLITLDEAAVRIIYQLVREYTQDYQTSFLISSHQDLEMPGLAITGTWQVQNQTLILQS